MAFQTSALPGMAAATAEMWSGISNAIATPWTTLGQRTKAPRARTYAIQNERLQYSLSAPTSKPTANFPEWVRDLPSAFLATANGHSTSSHTAFKIGHVVAGVSRNGLFAANPFARRVIKTPSIARQISTATQVRVKPTSVPFIMKVASQQTRAIGSFGMRGILQRSEKAANKYPQDPGSQNLFYQALLHANMPAIVVERYQTGQFATNQTCDAAYQKALGQLGQSSGNSMPSQYGSPAAQPNHGPNNMQTITQAAVAAHNNGSNSSAFPNLTNQPKGPLHVVVDESWGALIFKYVRMFVWWGLSLYLFLSVGTFVVENFSAVKKFGPGKNDAEAKAEHQTVRFSDVHGCDEAKEELQELVAFLKDPEKFSTLGGKLPKGVLLVGPPGTGKTLMARAVAGEAGVPFFFMSGSEFDEVYVGVGARRVRELFNGAKAKSPSIIFIDELDAIGAKRSAKDAAFHKQTLNQLLTELDGFEQSSGVIIIAATNFPELLDKALTRPGRFDRNVNIDLPDVRGRIAILRHHMRKIITGPDVRIEDLAAGTPGFSGAELENVVNQAAVHASKIKAKAVSMLDLDWAKDKVMMGAEKRSMVMSQKEKEMTAYHEAGHALVSMFNPVIDPLYKVTIMPRGSALGVTHSLPEMDKYSKTRIEYQGDLERCLAGKVAEEIVYGPGNVTSGCESDLHTATRIAYVMVTRCGMSPELGNVDLHSNYNNLSTATRELIESEIRRLIEESRVRATDLLKSKRKELDLLAKALLKYETLNKEEAFQAIRGEKLDHKLVVPSSSGGIKIPAPPTQLPPSGTPLPEIPGSTDGGQGRAQGQGQGNPPLRDGKNQKQQQQDHGE